MMGRHLQQVTGVHNWYPGNIELEIPGQMLYLVESSSNRFESCMIDNGLAVFNGTGRGLYNNQWLNGLEYSDHDVTSKHGIMLMGDTIKQFIVQRAYFDHAARIYHVGSPTPTVEDTFIIDNMGPMIQASRAALSLKSSAPKKIWKLDFSKSLLFPIDHIRVVTPSGGQSCSVAAVTFSGFELTVETTGPVTSVFAEVDASAFTANFGA